MRNLTSIVALVAVLGGALATPLSPAIAQDATTAARLRAAVGQAQPLATQGTLQPAVSFSSDELNKLVARIALYPDALLAQVLVAATFPDQVSDAGDLIQRAPGMSDSALSDAVAAAHWDESVLLLLAGFPTVLSRMAGDPDWTRQLGEAVTNDNPAVMAAVQHMRTQAVAAGNLTTNRAQVVNTGSSGITIRSADPKVVYVPQYDPVTVYSTRDAVYSGPAPVASSGGVNPIVAGALGFGAGFLVSKLVDNHDDHDDDQWSGYWQRDDVFDWHSGGFYPRPGPGAPIWAPPPGGGPMPPPPPPFWHSGWNNGGWNNGGWNNGPGPRPPAPWPGGGPRNGNHGPNGQNRNGHDQNGHDGHGQNQNGRNQNGQNGNNQNGNGRDHGGPGQGGQGQGGQNQHGQNQNGQDQHGKNQHGQNQNDQNQNGKHGNGGNGNSAQNPGQSGKNSGHSQGNQQGDGPGNGNQTQGRKHPPGDQQGGGGQNGGSQGQHQGHGQNQKDQDKGQALPANYCRKHPDADICHP